MCTVCIDDIFKKKQNILWIHSKYVKWFLTSNETFSRKIAEV